MGEILFPTALKERLIGLLLECQALQFGEFVLKSGDSSPFFVDLGRVSEGGALLELGEILGEAITRVCPDVDVIFGPAYKGIVLATAAAMGCKAVSGRRVGILYDRKERKEHGEGGNFVGQKPKPGSRVVLIDDVMSSGGTKLESIKLLETTYGVSTAAVLVTVDRTRKGFDHAMLGIPNLNAIVTINDLAEYLRGRDAAGAERMLKFWRGE